MNHRRTLLAVIGAGVLAPLAGFAQQKSKVWRVGFLWESEQFNSASVDAFKAGLREFGYIEGRDYSIEHRSARNDIVRLSEYAAQLVALKPDLIVAPNTPSALAARNATREIPILVVTANDAVGSGLAESLAHPARNVTGLVQGVGSELYSKRLEILREIVPGMRRVGFLYKPGNAGSELGLRQIEADCGKLGIKVLRAPVRKGGEIADAFAMLKREKAQALIVGGPTSNFAWRNSIIEEARKHRLPAIYGLSSYADLGGLVSYGADALDSYRRVAAYADKIFKGAKPGDLPIEQPAKFELVVNLKTAKALNLKIPQSILVQAARIIE